MQKIKQYISSRKYIFIVVVLFFLIRVPFLDSTFLLYDERDTVLTQYSLAKTGKDLYGNQTPLTFTRISPQAPVLAMYYGVPFWYLGLPKTVAMARFIYLLPATILPLLVFELIYAITKQKKLSLLTSIIFSFSPWIYHISRLALEINLAFPLFLTAILLPSKKASRESQIRRLFHINIYLSYRLLLRPIQLCPEMVEHLGMTPLEAMACGTIPFCFNGGGPKEIITDGVNGFLFNNKEELLHKTKELLTKPMLQMTVQKNGKDYVNKHFSFAVFEKKVKQTLL